MYDISLRRYAPLRRPRSSNEPIKGDAGKILGLGLRSNKEFSEQKSARATIFLYSSLPLGWTDYYEWPTGRCMLACDTARLSAI